MSTPDVEISVVTSSAAETEALGRRLGAVLRSGDVIALDGDLGAGKTVFVRGLAAGAGADATAVRSPTFVLHHVYRGGRVVLHHLDCYRLGPGADLDALDVEGLVERGAVAVEWAEYAPGLPSLRPVRVQIDLAEADPSETKVPAEAPSGAIRRLEGSRTRRRITLRHLPAHLAEALR